MVNIYKYYDDYSSLDGLEQYKQKLISSRKVADIIKFAKGVIKGRFEEAEPYIMKAPQ